MAPRAAEISWRRPIVRRSQWLSGDHLARELVESAADPALLKELDELVPQTIVLNSTNPASRAQRAKTLSVARGADPIPISEAVMVTWARLVADCKSAGIQSAVRLTDALIAATAVEHGLAVVTQDEDFRKIAKAHEPLEVDLDLADLGRAIPLQTAGGSPVGLSRSESLRRQ